jgi:hypothetical protein
MSDFAILLKDVKATVAEQHIRETVFEITRKTLADMNPTPGAPLVESVKRALEQPLTGIGVSLEKIEQKGDKMVVSIAKELPRMLDVTVVVRDSKKEIADEKRNG